MDKVNNKQNKFITIFKNLKDSIFNWISKLSPKSKASLLLVSIIFLFLLLIIIKCNILPSYSFIGTVSKSDKIAVTLEETTIINLDEYNDDIVINKGGKYQLIGSTENQIIINCKNERLYLLLNNASVSVNEKPAIYCMNAKGLIISLSENSSNTITSIYASSPDSLNGVIYCKSKLVINGTGELTINGENVTGIHASDELIITGGTTNIITTSITQGEVRGIKVNDSFVISDGTLNITSNGDGIKCEDDNVKRSIVSIIGGNVTINSKGDGIQAKTRVEISGGNVEINAGYNSLSSKGIKAEELVYITGGTIKIDATVDNAMRSNIIYITGGDITTDSTSSIRANEVVYILGGTFDLDNSSNGIYAPKCYIYGGTFTINADNKGIKTVDKLIIKGGDITVASSYEGFESAIIKINDGNISINAKDDGMNVNCEPHDAMGGMGNSSTQKSSGKLIINGGNIYVKAAGDGLDSNEKLIIRGGIVLVDGPSDSSNGALDYDTKCVVKRKAVLIAVGGSGMAQAPTRTVPCIYENVSCSSGTLISVANSKGKTLLAFKSAKSFSNVVICSKKLTKGKTYTLYSGGTIEGEATFKNYYSDCTVTGGKKLTTAEAITSSSGESSMGGGMQQSGKGGRFIKRRDPWQLS